MASASVATRPVGSIDGIIASSLSSGCPRDRSGHAVGAARAGTDIMDHDPHNGKDAGECNRSETGEHRTSPLCFAFSIGAN
jgi:hypothetical protein